MKDFTGHEIKVGDWIAYAGRWSSSTYMVVAKVLEIKEVPHRWKEGITIPKLKVERHWESANTWWRDGAKISKPNIVWLEAIHRCVKLEARDA